MMMIMMMMNIDEYDVNNYEMFRWAGSKSWTTAEASIMSTILRVSLTYYNYY